jgi:hypothetical protein
MKLGEVLARATGRLMILLAVVAVPAGIYMLVVVKKQEAFYTARNLRAVAEVGAQLNDRLDAVQQISHTFPFEPRPIEKLDRAFTPRGCDLAEGTSTNTADVADALNWWCQLRQWGDFVEQQGWGADGGSALESRLDEVGILIDEHVASTKAVITTRATDELYCGAYARLNDYLGLPEVVHIDAEDDQKFTPDGLLARCEEPVPATVLLDLLRRVYGSMDYASVEYELPVNSNIGALGQYFYDLPDLDIAIVEAAYLTQQPTAVSCIARAGGALDSVGLRDATVADLDAVWSELNNCPADTSPALGVEVLERWHAKADEAYRHAPFGSELARANLEFGSLLQMLLRGPPPTAELPVASFLEIERVLEAYPVSGSSDDRVAALAAAVSALERGMESLDTGCRSESGYCSHRFDKRVTRVRMLAQLRTTEWFRNLNAGRDDSECPTSTERRQAFPRPDAEGNQKDYYSTLVVETGQEPTVVATVCQVPATSNYAAVSSAAPSTDLTDEKRVDLPRSSPQTISPDMVITVPLRDLVESRRLESGFDGILLADCRGEVLFSDTARQLSVLGIAGLLDTSTGAASSTCVGPGQSWTKSTTIAGVPMRVFGHPYQPAGVIEFAAAADDEADDDGEAGDDAEEGEADDGDAGDDDAGRQSSSSANAVTWYVIGLQAEASFQRKARVMPFEVVVVIAPLVAVAVLAWPFMILVLSGVGARFGHGTPLSFTASAVGGAGVLTIIGYGLVHHGATVELRNQLLWRVADEVQTAFAHEIEATLRLFGPESAPRPPFIDADEGLAEALTGCEAAEVTSGRDNEGAPDRRCYAEFDATRGGRLLSAYSLFELAFALNADGYHEGRHLSLRDAGSSRNRLDSRGYFQRAKKGLLLELEVADELQAPAGEQQRFAVEQIRSKDFGWLLTAFSMPGNSVANAPREAAAIVVIRRLQTFFAPVLPTGVGFAVVRNRDGVATLDGDAWRAGDVLFHSDESRSLVENILSETDDDETLARTLQNRSADWVDVDYRGLPHRFYTEPLPIPSWSLIMTYDKEALRLYTWRAMLVAGSAFLAYLLALVLSACIAERLAQRRWTPAWIVPSAANGQLHACAALALSAVAIVLLAGGSAWVGPTVPGYVLWVVLLGNAFCIYGLLTGYFGQAASAEESGAGSQTVDWRERTRQRAVANRTGAAFFGIGLAFIASSIIGAGFPGSLWSVGLLVLYAGLYVAPRLRLARLQGSDTWFIFFLVALLATGSAVPALMLVRDAHDYQEAVYEKFNLAQVAASAERRTTALNAEARRLQPRTFDRAEASGFGVSDDIWCSAFFAVGTSTDNRSCPLHERESGDTLEAGDETAGRTRALRSATSIFGDAIPPVGAADLIFSDSGRMVSDDGAITWSLAAGSEARSRTGFNMSVTTGADSKFSTIPGGLFDRDAERHGAAPVNGFISWGALTLVCGLLLFLIWRALGAVVITLFGPEDLRRKPAGPRPERETWASLTMEEKAFMRHIAAGKLVNCRKNESTVRSLANKGYLDCKRGVRIADAAIATEIQRTPPTERELAHQRSLNGGAWAQIRLPFLTILALAVVTLIVTTPEALRSGLGVLAGSAAGVGVIIQLLNLFMRARQ